MCFVNSQNVRDLRQPFGGTKASGTGREGGTWSFEVFLEPKNICVSITDHHTRVGRRVNASPLRNPPRTEPLPTLPRGEGARRAISMSLDGTQKLLFHLNRDAAAQKRYRDDLPALLDDYDLVAEEREAILAGDVGKLYVLGATSQLLMHFAALLGMPWADYIEAMREGVRRHGPVRAGIYAMTTSTDEKVAGV